MAGIDSSSISLHAIINKLVHPLEEIRLRSLNSIFLKLQFGIIKDDDLIKEKQLFANMLEWFNFSSVSKQEDVLNLLLRLSKHPVALDHLVSLGTVKFLSDLRENQNERLQKLIDKLLESLFMLPDINAENAKIEVCPDSHKPQDKANVLGDKNESIVGERVETFFGRSSGECKHLKKASKHTNSGQEYSGFKLLSLKLVNISATDLHILASTNESLQSNDSKSVSKSCSFLNDVLFRDFPSEIFLQHSQIVKSLLLLLNYSSKNSNHLPLKAINCLLSLTKSLITQINSCRDAVLYNLKQGPTDTDIFTPQDESNHSTESLDSRPSVIGQNNTRYQGDGQDGDISPNNVPHASNHRDSEQQNSTDTVTPIFTSHHSHEIGLPQYCASIFLHSSSLLQSSNPQVLTAILELLIINCDLLNMVIDSSIWNDPSNLAEDMTHNLFMCYDTFSSAVMAHYNKCLDSTLVQSTNVKTHRVSVICITAVLTRLLEASLPHQEISHIHIPESCLLTFPLLIMDFLFEKTQPELHSLLLSYSRSLNENCYLAYQSAANISKALECALQCQNLDCDLKIFFSFSLDALPCLHYFHYWGFVDSFILKYSEVCAGDIIDSDNIRMGSLVLRKLLAYPENEVRKKSYEQCLRIVKDSIQLHQMTNVSSIKRDRVAFLLDSKIVEQIICFGLEDTIEDISAMTREIILTFLHGKMLMKPETWTTLLDCLEPLLSVLQAYTDTRTPFGIALFHIIDTDNSYWPRLTVLRANTRLLFSKDQRLRTQVIPRIAWFLAKEDNAIYKHPSLSQFDASSLANIFMNDEEFVVPNSQLGHPYSYNIDKLYQTFESQEESIFMRKAAGQQLAFLINDPNVFQQFKYITTYSNLVHILDLCLTSDAPAARHLPNAIELIPVIIEIIYGCLTKDASLMQLLELNESIYYTMLRALLIQKMDNPTVCRIKIIMACLLFHTSCDLHHDNAGVTINISSPAIIQRFTLPCAKTSIQCISKSMLDLPTIKFDNAQIMHLFSTYLKFSWNAAFANGWNKLIALDPIPDLGRFSFTDVEKQLIEATYELSDPFSSFQEITKATSHKPVLLGVKSLSWQLFTMCLKNKGCTIPIKSEILQMAFSRFLAAPPKSNADKTLLKTLLQFFNLILNWSQPLSEDTVEWMYSMVSLKNGALLSFLAKPSDLCSNETNDDDSSSYSPLLRELLAFLIILLSKTPYNEQYIYSSSVKMALSSMIHFILKHMNLAEAPQYYNLASLEAVLQCLVHITARPGFSQRTSNETGLHTCRQLTALLMEVVAAFHLYRDGTNHTFMGRGITLSATVCLNHVAAEMQSFSGDEGWINDWLYHAQNETDTQHGLGWLIPLWTHSDPQVRASSLSIIVCLTNSKAGCQIVMLQIQQVAQGLIGVALNFLLDHFEASVVREQASLLLVNLTSHFLNAGSNSSDDTSWQRLIIIDTETQTPLIGTAALIVLLHRSSFMHEMTTLFENFSVYPTLMYCVVPQHVQHDSPYFSSCNSLSSYDFGMNRSLVIPLHHTTHVSQPGNLVGGHEAQSTSSQCESLPKFQTGAISNNATAGVVTSALATPALVTSICLLLKNLLIVAPQDTMIAIQNERIYEHLVRILEETKRVIDGNGSLSKCNLSNILELIDMMTFMMELLITCCQTDPGIGAQLSQNKSILGILFSCLTASTLISSKKQQKLWNCIYALLTFASLGIGENDISLLGGCIIEQLYIIVENLEVLLQPRSDQQTRCTAMIWLTQSFSTLYKKSISDHQENKQDGLLTILEIKDSRINEIEVGARIAAKLLTLHNAIIHAPENLNDAEEMITIINVLNTLVILSQSAKNAAINGGLIRSGLRRLKRIHAHINFPVENPAHGFNFAKNRQIIIQDVVGHLNLLENLMHQCYNAKIAAHESELVLVVSNFWTLAVNERAKMLPAVLSLLCTYIAHCPPAGKSLGYSVPSSNLAQRSVPGTASLLHKIINVCRQELTHQAKHVNNEILELCFTLLATSSFSHACRIIIIKNKLLHRFSIEGLQKIGKGTYPEKSTHLWLKLFINLSFKPEGQEAIFNVPDIFDSLLILANKGNLNEKEASLLILRNLCFLPSGKAKLLNSAGIINILTSCALNGSQQMQALATAAIWELLANSQRAKTTLKSDCFLHRVQDSCALLLSKENLSRNEAKSLEMLQMIQSSLENA